MTDGTGATGGRETREEILARVQREQERLSPMPEYSARSKRRLRIYLALCVPVSVVVSWVLSLLVGWTPIEWVGFAVGLTLVLAYLGYLFIAERDDGRIDRGTRALVRDPADD